MSRNEEESKESTNSARRPFSVGSRVRVRNGTKDPDFPDIPLGGWTGTVLEAANADEGQTYLVEWDETSLRQMHPVYRRRCERDGLEVENAWVSEADLDWNTGTAAEIEQPTHLTPRPLDLGDQADRIRAVFNLTSDDTLPKPNLEQLAHYHRYLSERLSFPLDAVYAQMTSSFAPPAEEKVKFVSLAPLEQVREANGLLAEIERPNGGRQQVELFDVETPRNDYVRQLIGDYSYWFCEAFQYALVEGGRQEIHLGGAPVLPSKMPLAPLLVRCGVYGALCGAVVGAVTATMEWAPIALIITAGLCMSLGYFLGNGLGIILRALQLGTQAPRLGGLFGAFVGAVVGAVMGALLIAYPGTVLGSVAGFIVGKTLAKCGVRRPGSLLSTVLGAGVGGVALACFIDPQRAAIGLLSGAALGAIIAVILVLLFLVSLAMFEIREGDESKTLVRRE